MPSESDMPRSGSPAGSSGAEMTLTESSGRLSRISSTTVVLLIVGCALTLLAMYYGRQFGPRDLTAQLIDFMAVLFLASSAIIVIRQLGNVPRAGRLVMAAVCLAILSQTLSVFEQIPLMDSIPVLGKDGFLHEPLENIPVPLAVVLLLAGFFVAALEAHSARERYATERQELAAELAERKRAEKALDESEEKYRDLVENLNEVVYVVSSDGTMTYISPAIESIVGYGPSDFIGQHFSALVFEDDVPRMNERFREIMAGNVRPSEYRLAKRSGGVCWVRISSKPVLEQGQNVGLRGTVTDISERKRMEEELSQHREHLEELVEERTAELQRQIAERKQAEEEVKASLREKEVLLREIHHRVKNNLQSVSSLLNLQARRIRNKAVLQALEDSRNRIRAMYLIHETLHQSEDLSRVRLRQYVAKLVKNLSRAYGSAGGRIGCDVRGDDPPLAVDEAVPLGLVINELLTNAFRHAFPDGTKGKISVAVSQIGEGEIELAVDDNGVGLPADLDVRDTETLGLQLVRDLAEGQLGGSVEVHRDNGTQFKIRLKGIVH